MSFPRRLEPELLDQLPADDPRAMRSRRDLERVNAWMNNASRMAGALVKHAGSEPPRTIVDLGSGDGQFALRVAQRLAPRWPNVTIILLDQQNIVSAATREAFAALKWQVEPTSADVFDFLARAPKVDAITANLFLHHFTDEPLARLLTRAAELTRLFVTCEPRRAKIVVEASRLLWVVGCNDVSVHDAIVSARAGFTGQELSALWPKGPWDLHEQTAGLFTHCFVARRTAPQGA
jgi:SAM-dependent methyltransferase